MADLDGNSTSSSEKATGSVENKAGKVEEDVPTSHNESHDNTPFDDGDEEDDDDSFTLSGSQASDQHRAHDAHHDLSKTQMLSGSLRGINNIIGNKLPLTTICF